MTPVDRAREAAVLSAQGPFGNAGPKQIIAAYEAALSAEGMVVVPKEASEEMMLASRATPPCNDWRKNIQDAWSAMIAAASQGEGG